MKNINVKISELFLLNSLFTGVVPKKVISEFFAKRNHRSHKGNYREGSEKYLAEVTRDLEVAALPNHNIVENYDSVYISQGYDKIEFDILSYTYTHEGYDQDLEQEYKREVTIKFLCNNAYWAKDMITSMEDLLLNTEVKRFLFKDQEQKLADAIRENLAILGDCFRSLLTEIVLQAHKEFKSVEYYTQYAIDCKDLGKCVVIGDKEVEVVYTQNELERVYEDYKNDTKFYDERDRVITHYSSISNYLDFHREHSPKV